MRRVVLSLLLTGLGAGPALAAEDSPVAAVTAIYRIYAGPKGDYQTGSLDDKRVLAYFTSSLRKALADMDARSRRLNEPILDFDPVTDSQDPTVKDLKIEAESDTVVAASFDNGGTPRDVVRYVFRREGAAWKVDDIRGGSGDSVWDLRAIIAPPKK